MRSMFIYSHESHIRNFTSRFNKGSWTIIFFPDITYICEFFTFANNIVRLMSNLCSYFPEYMSIFYIFANIVYTVSLYIYVCVYIYMHVCAYEYEYIYTHI